MNKTRIFLHITRALFPLALLLFAPLCALGAENWVLAAEAFKTAKNVPQSVVSASSLIPQIILDYFSSNIDRAIFLTEMHERTLHELLISRQSLFLELSAAVKKRDKLLFDISSSRKKALAAEEKNVAACKEKISKNIEETNKILAGAAYTHPDTPVPQVNLVAHNETIALWKDDHTQLFVFSQDKTPDDSLNEEKINGFISGEVRVLDDYAAVTATLRVYPGGRTLASITEIGRLSESADIARRLADTLLPVVVQTLPIKISFDILPETARKNTVIYVDEMVYSSIPQEITLDGGIHTITIQAQGYKAESWTMNFEGDKTYVVHAALNELLIETISLSLKKQAEGQFFINSLAVFPTEEDAEDAKTPTTIIIEAKNSTVFGQFTHTDGNSSYFYLPPLSTPTGMLAMEQAQAISQTATVNVKNIDVVSRIETSRKIMYASYAAAMVSLPVLFFSIGEYTQYNNGWILATNRGDNDSAKDLKAEAEKWQTINNVCIGVTATLGVNFFVQLIIYLVQANKVLPEKAKTN